MNKKGFTLVELIIAMAILSVMVVILVGILNPVALINRARDTRRKKDLRRISISFEDYYNDNGCYPSALKVSNLILKSNCGSKTIFNPWLAPWPCDPDGDAYQILVGYDKDCPKWFKLRTTLENTSDKDINLDLKLAEGAEGKAANYGISSGNVSVGGYPGDDDEYCFRYHACLFINENGQCNEISDGCGAGGNCFRSECSARCQVSCCGGGCN